VRFLREAYRGRRRGGGDRSELGDGFYRRRRSVRWLTDEETRAAAIDGAVEVVLAGEGGGEVGEGRPVQWMSSGR
jgi:hypothetical protein